MEPRRVGQNRGADLLGGGVEIDGQKTRDAGVRGHAKELEIGENGLGVGLALGGAEILVGVAPFKNKPTSDPIGDQVGAFGVGQPLIGIHGRI